jgi:hypothetical protein
MLLAAQTSPTPQALSEDAGQNAARCAAFYQAVGKYVAKTDQERGVTKQMLAFMLVLGQRSGISVDAFEQIRAAQETELDKRVSQNDRTYLDAEKDYCSAFTKHEAEKLQAERKVGG